MITKTSMPVYFFRLDLKYFGILTISNAQRSG
jgi:hypothetical protein